MTPPLVHEATVLNVSHPAGFRGACTCGWTAESRQGAAAVAERDAKAHVKEETRCRKRAWSSKAAAERAIVDTRQPRKVAELCADPDCRGWHLTSQPQQAQAL